MHSSTNTAYSAHEHWSFDESFKFLRRGLLVFICTTGQTLCLYILMVFWTDWPQLDCHTRLCNSTVCIPFTQGPLLNHSSWNPSLRTVFSALESSSSFKKANYAITAPGMAACKFHYHLSYFSLGGHSTVRLLYHIQWTCVQFNSILLPLAVKDPIYYV